MTFVWVNQRGHYLRLSYPSSHGSKQAVKPTYTPRLDEASVLHRLPRELLHIEDELVRLPAYEIRSVLIGTPTSQPPEHPPEQLEESQNGRSET